MVNLAVTTYQRKNVGRKYKGTVLFLRILEYTNTPTKVENYFVCSRISRTVERWVRVEDMCTLFAEVDDKDGDEAKVNLLSISHAFPVSWIA